MKNRKKNDVYFSKKYCKLWLKLKLNQYPLESLSNYFNGQKVSIVFPYNHNSNVFNFSRFYKRVKEVIFRI